MKYISEMEANIIKLINSNDQLSKIVGGENFVDKPNNILIIRVPDIPSAQQVHESTILATMSDYMFILVTVDPYVESITFEFKQPTEIDTIDLIQKFEELQLSALEA